MNIYSTLSLALVYLIATATSTTAAAGQHNTPGSEETRARAGSSVSVCTVPAAPAAPGNPAIPNFF